MQSKQRLELTWIGKENRPRLEPRILLEDSEKSYHAKQQVAKTDIFDNRLIFGDNLLALKALEQEFSGKVKCVYIDPPYNTGKAFEHYDDAVEHSLWLSLMRDRLSILYRLLRPDGFLCCHIDDSEGHYLKVLLDEIFGREHYLSTMYVQVRYADKTLTSDMAFHKEIEQVHVYRKDWSAKPVLNRSDSSIEKFGFYIRELGSGRELSLGGKRVQLFNPGEYAIETGVPSMQGLKEIWATGGILDGNSSGRFFRDYLTGRVSEDGLGALYRVEGIGDDGIGHRYFTGPKRATATKGKYFQGVPLAKQANPDADVFSPIENYYDFASYFGNCRHEGGVEFRSGKKPEKLLETILKHFSEPDDLVLDSFAGSGTTGAVAHKMRRRWIMIELGEHAQTHIIPRLAKVIDGEDSTGVTMDSAWTGGGGFRYFHIAPTLLDRDRFGNLVISKEYNPAMLAEAMCKIMGFTYAPSDELYWQQGHSTENDFLYVTTQTLTREQLERLNEEVGEHRSLLICCAAFRGKSDGFPRLTIKKIPSAVLAKCEWGHDDYSLNVANLPKAAPKVESATSSSEHGLTPKQARRRSAQPNLFSIDGNGGAE